MGDVYTLPEKIHLILETMANFNGLFEGVDSSSPQHKLLEDVLERLAGKLLNEIDLFKPEE